MVAVLVLLYGLIALVAGAALLRLFLRTVRKRVASRVWFPRIPSGGIRTVRENQRIIMFDGRAPPIARIVCRRPVQVDGDLKPRTCFSVITQYCVEATVGTSAAAG
jgi:hypothetical protein